MSNEHEARIILIVSRKTIQCSEKKTNENKKNARMWCGRAGKKLNFILSDSPHFYVHWIPVGFVYFCIHLLLNFVHQIHSELDSFFAMCSCSSCLRKSSLYIFICISKIRMEWETVEGGGRTEKKFSKPTVITITSISFTFVRSHFFAVRSLLRLAFIYASASLCYRAGSYRNVYPQHV